VKAAIFSFMRNNPGTIIPSTRIARHVSEKLDLPIFWMNEAIAEQRDLDLLIIINGAYAFCKVLPQLAEAIRTTKRLVWIQNDYTIIPPKHVGVAESPFRKAFLERRAAGLPDTDFWSTCEPHCRLTPLSRYVNWNALAWEPIPEMVAKQRREKADGDLYYYGSYRASRERYFKRYFGAPAVPTTVSSPSNRRGEPNEKFVKNFPKVTHVPKVETDLIEELSRHGAGLYIEDKDSHATYHSPANRFYEMVSAGLPVIFQTETVAMFQRKAGMDIGDWACMTDSRMQELFEDRENIAVAQREYFHSVPHRDRMDTSFDEAWAATREALS
jgi:hypothetical protein